MESPPVMYAAEFRMYADDRVTVALRGREYLVTEVIERLAADNERLREQLAAVKENEDGR